MPDVPRTWVLPTPPSQRTRVRDRFGAVWSRPYTDPGWVDLWDSKGMVPQQWHDLLKRGPLTEVT